VSSQALTALRNGIPEVDDLLSVLRPSPPLRGTPTARAIRRASTVVLSSHYERYVYALNEEAVQVVNAIGIPGSGLPLSLRLYHTRPAVELMAATAWERDARVEALRRFMSEEGWLWTEGVSGTLEHSRLLEFMTAPKPEAVLRYFAYWGIPDIFTAITRTPHIRARLFVKLLELVDKRNGIAHGDPEVEPTYQDVVAYRSVVRVFAERVDRVMSRRIGTLVGSPPPW
jgi:hypothetical protein